MSHAMTRLDLRQRPMVEADSDFIIPVLQATVGFTAEDFLYWLYHPQAICIVSEAKRDNEPMAFGIFNRQKFSIEIIEMATLPKYRRCRVATHMMNTIITRGLRDHCNRITTNICELQSDTHAFLASCGFKVINTFPGKCGCGKDLWHFSARLKGKEKK